MMATARLWVVGILTTLTASISWARTCPSDISHSTSGSGTPGSFSCTPYSTGVYNINIVATSTGILTYAIEIDNGISIHDLVVKNEGDANTVVTIVLTTAGRVESVRRHEYSSGEVWIDALEADAGIGASTSPNGEISVDRIGSLNTGGDITAAITVNGASGESMAVDSISCDGNLMSDINVLLGSVGSITVGGDFYPSISTVQVGDLDSIVVTGVVRAALSVSGTMRRFEAGQLGIDGVFESQINAHYIDGTSAGIFIHGDWVSGHIEIEYGSLVAPVEVDGCFGCPDNNAKLELISYADLIAQVTINKGDDGGTWGSEAMICFINGGALCSASIDEPYYTLAASTLGGGSVGLAPFHLHDESCSPANGDVQYFPVSWYLGGSCLDQCDPFGVDDSVPDNVAIVRHYGPVQWASGDPLTVKRRSLACGGSETWTDVTSSFDFEINSGSGDREIKVTYTGAGYPYWPIDFEYRIEPVAGVLKCKNVDGNPDVADYDYEFTLVAECEESFMAHYDQNNDEALSGLDLVAWSASPVDLNGDAVADGADLSDLWEVVQTHGN